MRSVEARIARERINELAADPAYRPYIIGYLLTTLDERHWPELVEAALLFVEGLKVAQNGSQSRLEALLDERFS